MEGTSWNTLPPQSPEYIYYPSQHLQGAGYIVGYNIGRTVSQWLCPGQKY